MVAGVVAWLQNSRFRGFAGSRSVQFEDRFPDRFMFLMGVTVSDGSSFRV